MEARKGYGDSIPSSELLSKERIMKYYILINQKYGIDRLRFGDLVLIEDHDNTHGPHYRQGAVSIGVIVHSDSFTSGHGPGVTVIMSADEDTLEGIIDPDANIANYMNKNKR